MTWRKSNTSSLPEAVAAVGAAIARLEREAVDALVKGQRHHLQVLVRLARAGDFAAVVEGERRVLVEAGPQGLEVGGIEQRFLVHELASDDEQVMGHHVELVEHADMTLADGADGQLRLRRQERVARDAVGPSFPLLALALEVDGDAYREPDAVLLDPCEVGVDAVKVARGERRGGPFDHGVPQGTRRQSGNHRFVAAGGKSPR
ncbi:MAG: hypothetical protein M5U09_11275 [Gammaproteobacteria bacterium]|nr:hypothetical protein [Gammaproteobacteria bacterium]